MLSKGKKNTLNKIIWVVFLVFMILSSSLPGFTVNGLGKVYPFRIALIFFAAAAFFKPLRWDKTVNSTFLLFCFIIFYGVIELFWCYSMDDAVRSLLNYVICAVFLIVFISTVYKEKKLQFILMAVGIILMVLQVMGLIEGITGFYFFKVDPEWHHITNNLGFYSPITAFNNPNDFVFVLLGFLPFFFAALKRSRLKPQIAFAFKAIYFVFTLILSYFGQTRMGYLALAFMAFIYLFLSKYRKLMIVLTIVLVLGLCINEAFNPLLPKILQESRIIIWKNIFLSMKHYFFMGMGAGNSYIPIPGIEYDGIVINPHFWFLEILAEFGIIVFALVMCWYIGLIVKSFKSYKTSPDKQLPKAAIVFLISFVLLSMMSSGISALPFFYFLLGLTVCCVRERTFTSKVLQMKGESNG